MMNDQELEQASSRLEDLRRHQEQNQAKQENVLGDYADLIEKYKRLKSDYEEERDSREKYKQLARGQERNPFVLVLIDGDGYIFDDDIVSGGVEGGQRAAQLLNEVVKARLQDRGLDHCRIMVRIYANLAGLSKAISKVKLCGPEKRSLASFAASFTRSNDLFDFVDAGDLKENADFKIRAMFRQFVENAQCRHIFFAACHDAGYVSEILPFVSNRDRITLIRNHALHPEFNKLKLRVEDFPQLFRTTPLDLVAPAKAAPPTQPPAKLTTSYNENVSVCAFFQKGVCKYGSTCRNQHVKPDGTASHVAAKASYAKEWRNASQHNRGNGIHQPIQSPYGADDILAGGKMERPSVIDFASVLPRQDDVPKDYIPVNAGQQRTDPYIPPPSPSDRAVFHARHSKHKLCNNHHLNGNCISANACGYDHTPVSPGVLNCLRQLATNMPCPKRGSCRSATCAQGHICQRADCRHRGGRAYCKFPASAHMADLAVAEYVPGTTAPRDNSRSASDTEQSGSLYDDSPLSAASGFTNKHRLYMATRASDSDVEEADPDLDAGAFVITA